MKRKGRIGVRLLLYFTTTMVVVFAMLLLSGGLVINNYIRRQSTEKLTAVLVSLGRDRSEQLLAPIKPFPVEPFDPALRGTGFLIPGWTDRAAMDLLRRGNDTRDVQALISDEEYRLVFPNENNDLLMDVSAMTAMLSAMRSQESPYEDGTISRLQTPDGIYYVSVRNLEAASPETPAARLVLFVNTNRYHELVSSVNSVLLFIVLLALGASVLASFLLARGVSRPLRQLAEFAHALGRGDFGTRPFHFRDLEISELGDHMNQTAEKLGTYDKEQKTFFQNVSHELRTPLMSIQGYAEGIRYGVFPDNAEAAEVIVDESRRLTGMVEDLLYLSRMDAAPTLSDAYPADLREILEDCAERLAGLALKQGKEIRLELPAEAVVIRCDTGAMGRAVDNLFSNGVRHAWHVVSATCCIAGDMACIEVCDDGEGIAGEDLPHLFERFYKGKTGHHGIGLAIVKSVAEQHGGTVSADNRPEGGAKFRLEVPVHSPEPWQDGL